MFPQVKLEKAVVLKTWAVFKVVLDFIVWFIMQLVLKFYKQKDSPKFWAELELMKTYYNVFQIMDFKEVNLLIDILWNFVAAVYLIGHCLLQYLH